MSITKEAIEALHQRIKDLAASSTPDQLAYLAKSLELVIDKKAIADIVQMTEVKGIIDAIQKRLKDLAANSTPDQLAYLAKALEAIVDKSAVSDIVQMTDGKLKELLRAARSHLNEINTNKENSISAITEAKAGSLAEINTLKTESLNALKTSSDSHISLLDTRKNTNIAAINSVGNDHKDGLKGLVEDFRGVNDVPEGSSIIGEIETRDEQLKASLINEIKTRDDQLKASTISEVKTRDEQLKNTFEIISDPEILLKTINENDLETWLSSTDNHKKFDKMLNNANAVLNVANNTAALDKLVRSQKAIQALVKSNVALNIIANTIAANALIRSSEEMRTTMGSSSVMEIISASLPAMNIMANSPQAIMVIVSSGKALHTIVQSESVCKVVENSIQNYRPTIIRAIDNSSSLFRKQTRVAVGDGTATQESGKGSATIYVPVSCQDDGDTDFSVNSLLTGNSLAYIARHSGTVSVSSGITLQGVQVAGSGSSVGNVIFDVYTAI